MIWRQVSAYQTPADLRSDTRRSLIWAPSALPEQRSPVDSVPPAVVREPESRFWAAQARLDEPVVPSPAAPRATIAVVREGESGTHIEAVVVRLAELAAGQPLLVAFGAASRTESGYRTLVTGLRDRLPAQPVIAIQVRRREAGISRDGAVLKRILADGGVPVVVTSADGLHDITAEISSYLRADRVLRVFGTTTGADLYQVWHRHVEPSVN